MALGARFQNLGGGLTISGAEFSEGAWILERYYVFLQKCCFCGNIVNSNIFDIAESLTQNKSLNPFFIQPFTHKIRILFFL